MTAELKISTRVQPTMAAEGSHIIRGSGTVEVLASNNILDSQTYLGMIVQGFSYHYRVRDAGSIGQQQ
ncbi:hypothetical protein RRG08_058714 [Elysia crispata]|uniref:Uncharacterized protein n=1 Tax=Elysia crispata TaxID=231223 RepID=A0AAE1D5T8_9GAST|nr:hypothetical protein RRG08_058714 [Elysia crispata]